MSFTGFLRTTHLNTAAAVAVFLLPPATVVPLDPEPAPELTSSEQREIVPAYFYPLDLDNPNSQWRRMCRVAAPHSIIIMNPSDGPGPGDEEPDANYVEAIQRCHAGGHKVVGYVRTTYGARDPKHVRDDVDSYLSRYEADGIFLDEMNNDAQAPVFGDDPNGFRRLANRYYLGLSIHIRLHVKDFFGPSQMVIGNPGDVSEALGSWILEVADVLVAFEGGADKYATWPQPSWAHSGPGKADAYRIAHLVHGVRSMPRSQEDDVLAQSRRHHAGYVYATPEVQIKNSAGHIVDDLWNELSPFWLTRAPRAVPPIFASFLQWDLSRTKLSGQPVELLPECLVPSETIRAANGSCALRSGGHPQP